MFYNGKTVLVTGHTGFKGTWLTQTLLSLGATVIGYSLNEDKEYLSDYMDNHKKLINVYGDIRNFDLLSKTFKEHSPEIVFHLAAQPIVSESYINTVDTYDVNVMGTVNVLECIRKSNTVKSVINVTTDKVYENFEWAYGYRETDTLNGSDPYSNSKSCSELITSSYKKSFLNDSMIPVSTLRAGNVIGGGDFTHNRIVPDCYRASLINLDVELRSPYSIRPYQHVLEPIFAYLLIAKLQTEDFTVASSYNIGPQISDCIETFKVVETFISEWGSKNKWFTQSRKHFKESNFLKLDISKVSRDIGWYPIWDFKTAIAKTVEVYKKYQEDKNLNSIVTNQIQLYLKEFSKCHQL